jgi:hypothetical protein
MRYISIIAMAFMLTGCSSKLIKFDVTSEPTNAPVEVNGYSMGNTPTTIELECSKKWVGTNNSPDGWARSGTYEVRATPPVGAGGDSQTKTIDPCSWKGEGAPSIFFDLRLKEVKPVDRIEVDITEHLKPEASQSKRDSLIAALRELRDAGTITQEEYEAKVLKLLEQSPEVK